MHTESVYIRHPGFEFSRRSAVAPAGRPSRPAALEHGHAAGVASARPAGRHAAQLHPGPPVRAEGLRLVRLVDPDLHSDRTDGTRLLQVTAHLRTHIFCITQDS